VFLKIERVKKWLDVMVKNIESEIIHRSSVAKTTTYDLTYDNTLWFACLGLHTRKGIRMHITLKLK
jgi:hypothetical protein